ncbi:hypothetical protein EYF80_014702 [Liparis tanakae]|uniref:Uncharacterized protein n=1 Tax=Liparis tanakae TaxID=230148 RepID=A0A4Z2IAN4_9TELE|nr:hypothetical protein EYF80_014702 [Liparis tanakae]
MASQKKMGADKKIVLLLLLLICSWQCHLQRDRCNHADDDPSQSAEVIRKQQHHSVYPDTQLCVVFFTPWEKPCWVTIGSKLKSRESPSINVAGKLLRVQRLRQARSAVSVDVERAEAAGHASRTEVAREAVRHLHRAFGCGQTRGHPAVAQGHEQAAVHGRRCGQSLAVHIPRVSVSQAVHEFGCMLAAAAAVRRQHAASAGLRHHGVHRRHELAVLVRIRRQQLLQKTGGAAVLAHAGSEAGLALWQRLQRHGGQGVHPRLAVHTFAVLLLRLRGHAGGAVSGVPGARLHHRRGGGARGRRPSNLRVVGREQVQVVQKVLHDILRAVSQRACHLREAGQGGGHLGPGGSWIAHVHVGLSEVVLGHEGREATAQSAGVGAGPRPEAAPRVKVVVAVGVGAARPLGVGAWAVSAAIRAALQGQLWGGEGDSQCTVRARDSQWNLCGGCQ